MNVVPLAATVDQAIITRLEDALRMAYAGEIASCGVVVIHRDGGATSGWAGEQSAFAMVGALETLKRDFMAANID